MISKLQEADARQYIGGEWFAGADAVPNINPSSGEPIGEIAVGSAGDVDRAVEAAAAAAAGWASTPAGRRAEILAGAADRLSAQGEIWSRQMAREMGKPVAEARLECRRAAAILHYFAEELHRPVGQHYLSDASDTWLFTRREPVGVVGLITPWNFPAAIPTWKLAPALAFGNAVVLKLASDAPATGLGLVKALVEAGLPGGVLNVVLGAGGEIGGRLVEHPDVEAISFTGSTEVGRTIIAAGSAAGKRIQAEMGGQNPAIVCSDANLDQAATALVSGAFASAGQKCTSTRRIYADAAVFDDLVARVVEGAEALCVGDALDRKTTLGPLVGRAQLEEVLVAVERATAEGTLLSGGTRIEDNGRASGYFMGPTVLTDLNPEGEFATDEVFGPAVAIWPTDSHEQAIESANRTTYGLSASIFTRDLDRSRDFVSRIRAGLVHVNSQTAGAEVHVPFGGARDSSYGPHEQGRAAIEFYTQDKTVYFDTAGE